MGANQRGDSPRPRPMLASQMPYYRPKSAGRPSLSLIRWPIDVLQVVLKADSVGIEQRELLTPAWQP